MRYDGGYGRGYGRGDAPRPTRGYDYGLRGFDETTPERGPVRARMLPPNLRARGGGGYDMGYRSAPHLPNRVTASYNRDYVHPQGERYPTNHVPYGGDVRERIVDASGYWQPFNTTGGSHTMRGSGIPMGWEREARYDASFRGYGRDYFERFGRGHGGGYGRDFRGRR
jgi:hypothetical protein